MNVGITRAKSSVLVRKNKETFHKTLLWLFCICLPSFSVLYLTDSFSILILAYQVVGSAATLKSDPLWKNLVESAEKRNRLFKVKTFYFPFCVKKYMNFFLCNVLGSRKKRLFFYGVFVRCQSH